MAQPEEVVDRPRVLVVDDDAALAEMLTLVLRNEGFVSQIVTRGDEAMGAFRAFRPDLVLLDLMLPGREGLDVCRQIRAESGVPIVMLTARSDTTDVVAGLEAGADDYVAKPYKPKELVARIRVRVRASGAPPEELQIGDLAIDVAGHAVTRRGDAARADPLEFDLLVCLAPNPRRCSPARSCWRRSGATAPPRTVDWSTCTCSGCGQDRDRPREPHDRGDHSRHRIQGGQRG